jgi:hypothetical protein
MLKNDDINRSRNSVSIKIYNASNLDPKGVCSHIRVLAHADPDKGA